MKALTREIGAKLRPVGARAGLLQVAGSALITAGAWWIYHPAGVIVAGIACFVLAGLSE